MTNSPRNRYIAEIFGPSWAQGPKGKFSSIGEARDWAESYGTTADHCTIRTPHGRVVATHHRDPNSRYGTDWYQSL